jgi:hypothetical protein
MTHVAHHSWVADERSWLHEVLEDSSRGWIGLLELVSFLTLVGVSAIGWISVLAVLLKSVA